MLAELKTHHQHICRLNFEGHKPTEIAERLDMNLQTIYKVLNDPMGKAYMDKLTDSSNDVIISTRKKISEMQMSALSVFDSILTGGANAAPASVRLNAAKDILDRNGHKAPEKHQHMHGHFTAEDLIEMKKRRDSVTAI